MIRRILLGVLAALLIGLILGFWIARLQTQKLPAPPPVAERKILYYRHPMNPKVSSPVPAKDEMGMDYLPVYADDLAPTPAGNGKGHILYYRHPMGAADTSTVPKKDEMGMDYLPVYEGEATSAGLVSITAEKIQKLGVKSAMVESRKLVRTLRALGSIQVDERLVQVVAPKFEGWIRSLHVNATGQNVRRGQVLLDVYSPDLLTAQQEYLIARQGRDALKLGSPQARKTSEQLAENALQRLRFWDIDAGQLRALEARDSPQETLALLSPITGTVLEKPAVSGMRFMPGEVLFRIADLRTVWLQVEVYEQDLAWIRANQEVSVRINAYPTREFTGKVSFIAPTVSPETRTAKVRVELSNPEGLLKPGIYGSVALKSGADGEEAVTVPESAVIDSGARQVVLVQLGDGKFEPRTVKLGRQADGYFEVLEGVAGGETVVTSANFLIDAESNLKSALEGLDSHGHSSPAEEGETGTAETSAVGHHHGGN